MTIKVGDIKGVSAELASTLKSHDIKDSDDLLAAGRTPSGRKELSAKLGITTKELMEFVNRADLARNKGVGAVLADMLENAGVDTVKELSTRKPENLHAKIVSVTTDAPAISIPSAEKVTDWVAQAKELGAGIEY